jgi:hypothetical protein
MTEQTSPGKNERRRGTLTWLAINCTLCDLRGNEANKREDFIVSKAARINHNQNRLEVDLTPLLVITVVLPKKVESAF